MRPRLLFSLVLALSALWLTSGQAQNDEFSIPGVDDTAPAGAPVTQEAADAQADAGASQGSVSLLGLIAKGGWAMWPLGIMSLAVIGLAVYCALDLRKKHFSPATLQTDLEDAAAKGDFAKVMERSHQSPTCLGQVLYGATEYISDRGYQVLDDSTIYDLMADSSQEFNRGRARTINYFSIIAQASPMLGLLGTVSGMIKAFGTLGSEGMGDPSQLAGNISEALVTTASGLIIALPALILYFFFRDQLTHQVAICDRQSYRTLSTLRRASVKSAAADPAPADDGPHVQPPAQEDAGEGPFVHGPKQ